MYMENNQSNKNMSEKCTGIIKIHSLVQACLCGNRGSDRNSGISVSGLTKTFAYRALGCRVELALASCRKSRKDVRVQLLAKWRIQRMDC